jgi:hypothetical protein
MQFDADDVDGDCDCRSCNFSRHFFVFCPNILFADAEKYRGESAGDSGGFVRKIERLLGGGALVDAADVYTGNTCMHWAAL